MGTRRGASTARAPRYNAGTFDGNGDYADKVWYNTEVCMTWFRGPLPVATGVPLLVVIWVKPPPVHRWEEDG